jgi:5-methylcytosine-specific restriction protein B|tara:strand:- start:243 stop:473 length:231 start_codon:yes stop_codon:yes gene_type:complete
MIDFVPHLERFVKQVLTEPENLKYSEYPKELFDLNMRVSFGMGMPAKIPHIALITKEMKVSNGFYPVYLFYKDQMS